MLNQNIFLLTGSNLGDRLRILHNCSELIELELGHIIERSPVYQTAPWGKTDQANFLNQALQIETVLQPQELLTLCLSIEKKIGRVRDAKWGARTIDIDIVYFDNKIVDLDNLKIPHPRIAERRFVLVPLNEVAPEFVHPIFKKTNAQLLQECVDPLDVKTFTEAVR